jgi:preprotein translocase subunit SecD
MKTIINSCIAILIIGILAMGFTNKTNTQNRILIQSDDSQTSSIQLTKSAEIISARLKDFSSDKFEVNIIQERKQIEVTLTGNWDVKTAENLLVHKGTLAFYETFTRKSFTELLKSNNQLLSMFNVNSVGDSSSVIGCNSSTEVQKVNDYLNTLELNQKCKLAWNYNADDSKVCLYALKTDALLKGKDIESVKANYANNNEIEITLKKSSVKFWADATNRNIGNTIAIVLDDKVIYAPVVRSVINGGHCTITGNLTKTEAAYIASLGNNGELPIGFKVVKE